MDSENDLVSGMGSWVVALGKFAELLTQVFYLTVSDSEPHSLLFMSLALANMCLSHLFHHSIDSKFTLCMK